MIYFAQAPSSGFIKIGYSHNPAERVTQIGENHRAGDVTFIRTILAILLFSLGWPFCFIGLRIGELANRIAPR